MVDTIEWPSALKITDRSDPIFIQNNVSGGMSISGDEQFVSALSGRWEWRVAVPVFTVLQLRELRKLKSKARGRFNYIRIPICDRARITLADVGGEYPDPGIPHSDETTHSDGAGYENGVTSILTADADAGDATIRIRASDLGDGMTSGIFFCLGDDWLYLVEDFELDGTDYVLTINPPIREDVASGGQVDFSASAIWSFGGDATGDIDLQIGRFGVVTIDLIEPVARRFDAA